MKILSKKIVKNVGWNIGGKLLAQVIVPLFAILIARILDPVDFGLFAIVAAVIGAIDIIKDMGISKAIIIEHDDRDFISMQFTVQLFLGIILYGIVFILSGHIALYFGNPKLKMALIVYALIIFIFCLESPLETFYMKSNRYNILFYRQILPVLFYGVITYLLAVNGFGVFALIIGHLSSRAMTACFLLLKSEWKPKIYFDLSVFMRLFNLGKHILTQSICGFFITQLDSLLVGKCFGVYKLGFYRTGSTLTHLIPNTVTFQTQKVVFSDVALRKNDHSYCDRRYYQYSYIVGSMAFVLSVATYFLSPVFITMIMGNKWDYIIPLVKIFSAALPTGMIVAINYDYSNMMGFSHVYTVLSIIRAAAIPVIIYIGSRFSLELTVICLVIASLLDNTANEIYFFRCQKSVKYRNFKLVFFIFAWLWAAYVITIFRWN